MHLAGISDRSEPAKLSSVSESARSVLDFPSFSVGLEEMVLDVGVTKLLEGTVASMASSRAQRVGMYAS